MPESEDRQSALKGILTEKMKANSGFAEVIGKLLDEVQNGAASAKIVFDQRGQNVGTQTNKALWGTGRPVEPEGQVCQLLVRGVFRALDFEKRCQFANTIS